MRGSSRSVLVASALALVALVLAAPVVAWPGAGGPADCAAADAGASVKLVLDFGILAAEQEAPATVSSRCVSTAAGASGLQVLEAGGHTYRMNNSGLLCAIDGFPRGAECGDRTADGYRYWAYFSGGSAWTYSGIGPTGRRVNDGAVEGWHFVSGKGNPTDPPPSASSQPCAPAPTTAPPTAAPTTAPAAPVTSAPKPASGTSSGGGNGNGSATGAGPATVTTRPGATPPTAPSAGAAPATSASGAPPAAGAGDDPAAAPTGPEATTATPSGTEPAIVDPSGAATTGPGRVDETSASGGSTEGPVEVAAMPAAARPAAGAPIAAILGLLAIVALGGFAALRMRARPEDA